MANEFGLELRHYRQRDGLSTTDLAKLSGTNQATINQAENGKRTPPMAAVPLWAKAFGLEGALLARFMRKAQAAKAYANDGARAELDALNADLQTATEVIKALVPHVKADKKTTARLWKLLAQSGLVGGDVLDLLGKD